MIDPNLDGKVVLITGANHGIGAATARAFARQGASVFITYYVPDSEYSAEELKAAKEVGVGGRLLYDANQQQTADILVREIVSGGGLAAARTFDLGIADNIPRLFDACEAEFGRVDILVNNHTHCVLETFDPAAINEHVILTNAESIDRHFAVNARAVALMMREYAQRYLARAGEDGCIVNISTDAAHAHNANVSYAASKHAIESYSRSAASELGKYGIRVNIVAPGPIQTGYITPDLEDAIQAGTPLGRVGEPEDVADVIVFMASAQARWLTGQLIYVGGGWRMSM
ncbi:MAG: SDR family oxidoreductase [Chloroflexi bacterium]|nr:SDR family oxidoreductase [Chloroflexota bacterium]